MGWFYKNVCFLIIIISTVYSAKINIKRGHPCTQPNGSSGNCTYLLSCPSLLQNFQDKQKKYLCTIEGDMEIYCCASDEIFKIVPTTNEDGIWTTDSASDLNNTSEPQHPTIVVASDVNVEQKHKIRSAKEACDFYKTNKIDLIIDHILGGDGVRINLYPHMCVLQYRDGSDAKCGGSLISNRWVLTAAHCELHDATHVILGRDDITKAGGNFTTSGEEILIEEIFIHDNYNGRSKHNDIALLKLSKAVKFSDNIYPACLYINNDKGTNSPAEGTNVTVSGFGRHHYTQSGGNYLLKGSLKISSHSECSAFYRNQPSPNTFDIISSQICAYGKQDSCKGDSGGPLQELLNEQKQISSIVGVVSYGLSCGEHPGIYTRVSSFLDWIEKHVWIE